MRAIFNDIPIKMIEYHGQEMVGVDTIEDFNKVKILLVIVCHPFLGSNSNSFSTEIRIFFHTNFPSVGSILIVSITLPTILSIQQSQFVY